MRARLLVTVLMVAVSSGCASGGATSGASHSNRSRDFIPEAEITSRARDATNALQIIELLRPEMLRSRGVSSPAPTAKPDESFPRVYVDDIAFGNINTLSNLSTLSIKEIRFINAQNATTRWGTGHTGGVILVTTKK